VEPVAREFLGSREQEVPWARHTAGSMARRFVHEAWRWLVVDWHWPAAGLVACAALVALSPVFWVAGGLPLLLVAL